MKSDFRESLRTIAEQHHRGTGGIRTALALTRALDHAILQTFRSLDLPSKDGIALVALGGYGRKELSFSSDTDIMFLVPQRDPANAARLAVQKLLHQLLDLGLDIGHSVRSIPDCLELRSSDIEAWVSLVESRFLCGDKGLFRDFHSKLARQIERSKPLQFVNDLVARTEIRHRKYGDSTKLLEPNIKNSAGGLRDLHTVLWLFLGSGKVKPSVALPASGTALTWLTRTSALRKHFTAKQLHQTRKSLDFLLRVRNQMHLRSKGLHDSLEFTSQKSIAESLRYTSTATRSSVERFMQDYFVASRLVAQFARRATGSIQREFTRAGTSRNQKLLDRFFLLREREIIPRTPPLGQANESLLLACLHALDHGARFSGEMEDWIGRNLHRFTVLKSRKAAELFHSIVNHKGPVGTLLHHLSEYGVLERWIPEWKSMVAFFQHNQYHYYTADEHTLRVIKNTDSLKNETGSFAEAYRSLPRKDVLVLSCLLHDIAKPQRVGHHEVAGAAVAKRILSRLRFSDIVPDVQFLVRHHLLMEQTAFRRNLSDPQTIITFSAQFRDPVLLDYLYVLTYADLSAVNKNVWTDWKGMLLFELYRKSREILEQRLTGAQVHHAAQTRHKEALKELVETLAQSVPESRSHLEAVDSPAYLAAFDAEEIAEHIRQIQRDQPVATTFKHLKNFTEITIIAKDAPSILSKFCGVLSANDANIFDAHVFTRNDGIVIDKFRVIDFVSRTTLHEQQCSKIHAELNDVVMGRIGIEKLMDRHRMKWRRLEKNQDSGSRSAVEFEEHPRFTIIDVFAPDRMGFLYRLTDAISRLNVDISFATIATRADGIVDSFYVLDSSRSKIESSERRESIRATLLETIRSVSDSELVQNQ